jgi:NAD(P)-dependent dehydrogenase (short-subunit alcohol dehydrogenase family)
VTDHPAIAAERTAVITGAADGVGLAVAGRLAERGLNIVMADLDEARLEAAAASVRALARHGAEVDSIPADVADADQVRRLRERAFARFGDVAVLMNNAGIGGGGHAFERPDRWAKVLAVNLGGVINGVQAFTQAMIDQDRPAAIVNTGSKQGITCPPGDTAYNVSKAGVKVLTEALAHSLRNEEGARISAHLLIPGSTFTGMTSRGRTEKPAGAWTADQVIDMLIAGMNQGDFYILCPDNDVTREIDNRRILWAAQDITKNRPPLSRWHADYKAAFDQFLHAEK